MLPSEFEKIVNEEIVPACTEITRSKGNAYSGLEDKLGNFKRVAKLAGVTPEQVLFIYMLKHIDAVSSFIRQEYGDSEPINSRIFDVRNYMDLLYSLLVEGGKIQLTGGKEKA